MSVSFTGSIKDELLKVTSVSAGKIEVGSYVTGLGIPIGTRIASQINGTPNGAGEYALFNREPTISSQTMTDSYGVLTVGSVGSGNVALGEVVTAATGAGTKVAPQTEIVAKLNGSSNMWVVNNSQTVGSEDLTMTGAPLSVVYNAVKGATKNSGSFWIYGNYNGDAIAASTLTSASGTVAQDLGLADNGLVDNAFYLAASGAVETSPNAWMNNFVANVSNEFSSFQTTYDPLSAEPAGVRQPLEGWAQRSGGQYDFLKDYSIQTPPIVNYTPPIVNYTGQFGSLVSAPEPSTWALAALGFVSIGLLRYRPAWKWKRV
jgi:hypothetical protein